MPLVALAAAALVSAPIVQEDGSAARADISGILQANVEGADTPFGWVPDLLTFSVRHDGCTTIVTRHQRRISRGSSYIRAASANDLINWRLLDRVVWTSIANTGRNQNGVRLDARNGSYVLYAFRSTEQRLRFMQAAETLKRVCSMPAPAPRPTPTPAPMPRPTPAATSQPWLLKYGANECYPRDLPQMMLSPRAASYATRSRAGDPLDSLKYTYYLDGTATFSKPSSWVFAGSSRTNGDVRSAKLLFDGRPASIVPTLRPLPFKESGRIDLPVDFLDNLGSVSTVSLLLLDARGNVLRMYDFDVRGASRFKEYGNRANWSCAAAR